MVEVPIERLSPKIFGKLGKEKPSKPRRKGVCAQCEFSVTSSVLIRFPCTPYRGQVKSSVCMPSTPEGCPVYVCMPEVCVRDSAAVRYAPKPGVMSHGTSTGL